MDQGPSGARSAAAEQRPPAVPGEVEKAERAARRAQDAPVAPRTLPPAPRRAHSGRRAPASPAAWSCADPRGPELARRCGRPRGAVRGARGRPPAHSDRCPATARPVCHALPLRTRPRGHPAPAAPAAVGQSSAGRGGEGRPPGVFGLNPSGGDEIERVSRTSAPSRISPHASLRAPGFRLDALVGRCGSFTPPTPLTGARRDWRAGPLPGGRHLALPARAAGVASRELVTGRPSLSTTARGDHAAAAPGALALRARPAQPSCVAARSQKPANARPAAPLSSRAKPGRDKLSDCTVKDRKWSGSAGR